MKEFCDFIMRNSIFIDALIFMLLLCACLLLVFRMRWIELAVNLMRRGFSGMDEASRNRLLESRRNLMTLQESHSLWYRLERELNYSGWKRKFPFLTVEIWIFFNVFAGALVAIVLCVGFGWKVMLAGLALSAGVEYLSLYMCKMRAFRSVNSNLIKFLDFLGNYSITAGELTGIFTQISRYLEEPLCSALDECSYEAATTGDVSLALLSMAEKIEHPKFKELARNMEISARYCADFTLLVNGSRKSMREYMRLREERKGMMREALINMALLLLMSVFTLLIVDGLIETSIWDILLKTLPGKIAMGVVIFISFLFVCRLSERR